MADQPPPPPGSAPPPYLVPPPGGQGAPWQPGPGQYPPNQYPSTQYPAGAGFPSGPAYPSPPPPKQSSPWPWIIGGVLFVAALVLVAAVVIVIAARGDSDGSGGEAVESPVAGDDADTSSGESTDRTPAGPADEVDDVGPCEWVDDDTIILDVTNNSSEQSTYIIDVNFLDASGTRVGDEPFFVNYLRPGERAVEASFVFDSGGGVACEIAEVERFSAQSPDDVDEVTCVTDGVDFADDIATQFTATNGSSELSDYFIDAALIRDGVRIGTAFVSIENVRPGESAPGDGFSLVDGPDTGVSCEVVHVQRTNSE